MEENLQNDPLEDFFRRNLEDSEAESTAWDTPDEVVWERISQKVVPPKKVFPLASSTNILLAVACGLALLFATLTWYYANENQQLKNTQAATEIIEKETNTTEISTYQTQEDRTSTTEEKSTQLTDKELIEGTSKNITEANQLNKKRNHTNDQLNFNKPELSERIAVEQIENKLPSTDQLNENNRDQIPASDPTDAPTGTELAEKNTLPLTTDNQLKNNGTKPNETKVQSAAITETQDVFSPGQSGKRSIPQRIEQINSLVTNKNIQLLPPISSGLVNPVPSIKKGWYLGGQVGGQWTNVYIENRNGQRLPQNESIRNMPTLTYGFRLGYQNSKGWNFGVELGSQRIAQEHIKETTLVFRGIKKSNDEPEVYALQTTSDLGGSSAVEVRLATEGSSVPVQNNSQIPIRITTERQISFVQIPLRVGYTKQWGALGIGLQTGPDIHLTTKATQQVTAVTSLDRRLRTLRVNGPKPANEIETNGYYLAWSISPVIKYQLSEEWSVALNGELSQGLNKVINLPRDTGLKTQQAQLNIGVQYHF